MDALTPQIIKEFLFIDTKTKVKPMSEIKEDEKKEIKKEDKKEIKLNFIDRLFNLINDGLIKSKISSGELMLIVLYLTEGFVAATITAKTAEVHPAVRITLHLIAAIISVYAGLNMIPSIEDVFKTIKSRYDYELGKFILKVLFDITESIIYIVIALTSPFLVFMLIASGLDQMDRVVYLVNNVGLFNIVEWFNVLTYTLNGTYLATIFHYLLLLVVAIGYGKKYIKKLPPPPPKEIKEPKKEDKKEEIKHTTEPKKEEPKKEEIKKPTIPAGLMINDIIFDIKKLSLILRGLLNKYDSGGSEHDSVNSKDPEVKIKSRLQEFLSYIKLIFPTIPITEEMLMEQVLKGKRENGNTPLFKEVLDKDGIKAFDTITSTWFNNIYIQSIKPFVEKLETNNEIQKHFLKSVFVFCNSIIKAISLDHPDKFKNYVLPGSDPTHFTFIDDELIKYTNNEIKNVKK